MRPSAPPPRADSSPEGETEGETERAEAAREKALAEEAKGALANAAGAVDLALLHVELAQRKLDTAVECGAPIEHVERLARTYNDHRDLAVHARDDLKIHRESVGIRQTRLLFKLYPVPPRR